MLKPINKVETSVNIGICNPTDYCGYCQGICWVIPSFDER